MKRALLSLVVVAALAGPTRAQPADAVGSLTDLDYASDSTAWNGLARLIALARGVGLEVEATTQLDWDELGAGDILFVLYPTTRLEPSFVAAFIRNGGHVLLADDFGQSGEALGRLSVLRVEPDGVDAARYQADRAYAPVARPWKSSHPLADGVDELVTNLPAVFSEVRGAEVVFGFGDGEAVVAAGSLGRGRVIMVSDPSIFINRMMQFGGNLQFAINALRWLGRPGKTTRLVILAGDFFLYGEPSGLLDDGTLGGKVDSAMSNFNDWLDERNDYLITTDALLAIGVALALLIALGALVVVPLRRKNPLDGSWTRAADGSQPASDFELLVAQYERPGARPSYSLPASIMRDTFNAALERVLESPEPLHSLDANALCHAIDAKRGAGAAELARPLIPRLKALPSRWQAASPWTVGYLSRREFERLHADVQELERALQGD